MRAMILAAGLGTRLRPLSYELAKPIIPVLGRPLCSYNMEFLHRYGVRAFVLNLHQHPKLIQQRVAGWVGRRMSVEYTIEPEILGTGGGIRNARDFLMGGTFVTANADAVVRCDLKAALAFHRARKALATLVLFADRERRYTPVGIDEEGRIAGFGRDAAEPAPRRGFYTGLQILEPDLLERIPAGRPSCIVRETYAPLIAARAPVYAFLTEGYFREFGTPADYLNGTLAMLSERAADGTLPAPSDGNGTVAPPAWLSPKATVSPGATIGPAAVVEDGASVGEGAVVQRSILWPGASVPAGERLSGAIVTPKRRLTIG